MNSRLTFLPIPRKIKPEKDAFIVKRDQIIQIDSAEPHRFLFSAGQIKDTLLKHTQHTWQVSASCSLPNEKTAVILKVDPAAAKHAEGYQLIITPQRIYITGCDEPGVFYGVQTLKQIITQSDHGILPCMEVEDYPDFPARGVMLDISRDKVYRLETLFMLIDELASWKINQLQLYMEHTFAYLGHEIVWQDASPLTAEDILQLDRYCRDRYIELVPNQNSLGHMSRWLKHKAYQHLAERTTPFTMPWGEVHTEPFSLAPVLPQSLSFISSLYDQLLPNFSSGMVNVGCDETFDIGAGKSEAACQEKGLGQVYLDYVLALHQDLSKRGKTMQFWADIILQHPELISQLPKDAIALVWGYDAGHPFDDETKVFHEASIPYYVCPGTSSWNSIGGRLDNMIQNCVTAAEQGQKNGAAGYLNTDWGDNGHWQQIPLSYPGFAMGAACSWCSNENRDLDLERILSEIVFKDPSNRLGALLCDMGNEYKAWGLILPNASPIFALLQETEEKLQRYDFQESSPIEHTLARLKNHLGELNKIIINRPDALWIKDEIKLSIQLMKIACQRALKIYFNHKQPTSTQLLYEIQGLIAEYQRIWLKRNRVGGLTDSIRRFDNLLSEYKNAKA